MSKRDTKLGEVKSAFRTVIAILLGFAWLGLVFGGMGVAFSPSPHPPIIGWVLLAAAALVLVVTMNHWVKFLFAILVPSVLGGLLTIVDGHALNHPESHVSRLDAVIMTLLIAACAVVSVTFSKRKLKLPDRIALFAFVFCFFGQAVAPRFMLAALGLGSSCLVLAWAIDRRSHSNDDASKRRDAVA